MTPRYELCREIARGGMGTVYEARHLVTGRRVALKVVKRGESSTVGGRLVREARLLGELSHPSIVGVLDFEETDQELHLVTELLEGRPLDGLITSRARLDAGATLTVLTQLAGALAHAHDRGIVHRDVKPANVIVVREGDTDRVKLIDFGVAGQIATRKDTKLTAHGDLLGTLAYAPPEQIANAESVDPRSDQYALGALALEALTGDVQPMPERLQRAPAVAPLVDSTGAPRALIEAIARLLEPAPDARFSSMKHLLLALPPCEPLQLLDAKPRAQTASARRHVRAPFLSPVRVVHRERTFDGRSENISERGLLVMVPASGTQVAEGDPVHVRFSLPISGRTVSAPATVRWARSSQDRHALGVELDELPPDFPAELGSYLQFFGADA